MRLLLTLAILASTTPAFAQATRGPATTRGTATAPARGPATTPTTTPSRGTAATPLNIDRALESLVTLDASNTTLAEFTDSLRKLSNTNLVISWNALNPSGITKETRIDFHVKDLPLEASLKALLEVLPYKDSRPNFYVSDNALTITTNADIGKAPVPRLYSIVRGASLPLGTTPATDADKVTAQQLFQQILLAEMTRAGDPLTGKDRGIVVRDGTVAATLSERGHNILERAIIMLNAPLKVGQVIQGTQLSAQAKRAQDALKAILAKMPPEQAAQGLVTIAKDPATYRGTLNINFFPGTADELAKPAPILAHAITDGGVVLIGPRETLRQRTVFAAYDLRDVVKKLAAKPPRNPQATPADFQSAVVRLVMEIVKPDGLAGPAGWGELGKSPTSLTVHNGTMMIFATPETHRGVVAALQEMNK